MSNDFTPVKVSAPIVTAGQNCWQIGNFYVTAQPTEAGLAVASQLGIKSVICLRDALETAFSNICPSTPRKTGRSLLRWA